MKKRDAWCTLLQGEESLFLLGSREGQAGKTLKSTLWASGSFSGRNTLIRIHVQGQAWWPVSLITALRKQREREREVDISEFKVSLIYGVPGQPVLHSETLSQTTRQMDRHTEFISSCAEVV